MSLIVGALRAVFGADTAAFEKGVDKVDRKLKSSRRQFEQFGKKVQGVGKSLSVGFTVPLAALGIASFKTATSMAELESAFDVTFKNSSSSMREWAKETGDTLGRSTKEIQESSVAFASLFNKALDPAKANEMTKTFAVLTQDLASFKDLSNDVAQQKLFSGLTGEAEPLKAVGVFINAAATEAKALELGLEKVNGKFTDQQKIVARAALIQEQLAEASGDVVRTYDSTANQLKRSSAAFEELRVVIGTKLLPVVTPLIEKIADALDWFSGLNEKTQNTILIVGGVVAAIGPLLTVIGTLSAVLAPLGAALAVATGATTGLGAAITVALGPVGLIIAAIGLLTGAYVLNKKKTEELKKAKEELYALIDESAEMRSRETASTKSQAKANLDEALSIRQRMKARLEEQQALLKEQQAKLVRKLPNGEIQSKRGSLFFKKNAKAVDETTRAIAASQRELARNLNEIDKLGKAYRAFSAETAEVTTVTKELTAEEKKQAKARADAIAKRKEAHADLMESAAEEIENNAMLAEARKISNREYEITLEMIDAVKGGFIGSSDALREHATALVESRDALDKVNESAEANAQAIQESQQALVDHAEKMREVARQMVDDHNSTAASVDEEIARNEALAEAMAISSREYEIMSEKMRILESGFMGTGEAAREMAEKVVASREKLSEITEETQKTEEALSKTGKTGVDAFEGVLNSFDSLLNGIKNGDLGSILEGVLGILDDIFGISGKGSGSGGSDILNGIKGIVGIFGGAREKGGPGIAGHTYLVGEKGPELFTPPSNGNFIANDKMGGTVRVIMEEGALFRPVIKEEAAGMAAPIAEVTTVRGIDQFNKSSRAQGRRKLA